METEVMQQWSSVQLEEVRGGWWFLWGWMDVFVQSVHDEGHRVLWYQIEDGQKSCRRTERDALVFFRTELAVMEMHSTYDHQLIASFAVTRARRSTSECQTYPVGDAFPPSQGSHPRHPEGITNRTNLTTTGGPLGSDDSEWCNVWLLDIFATCYFTWALRLKCRQDFVHLQAITRELCMYPTCFCQLRSPFNFTCPWHEIHTP